MSNVIHADGPNYMPGKPGTACGRFACFRWAATSDARARVTCKRCLASLAKRDREFRRKARAQFTKRGMGRIRSYCAEHAYTVIASGLSWSDAARAIAHEEGRAP